MMKKFTRALALLLTLVLTLSTIPGSVAAAGEEVTEDDIYVLQQKVAGSEYTGPNVQYASPYVTDYRYADEIPTIKQSLMYSMYNSSSKTVIPAYCMDIRTPAHGGNVYHRLNLEDATYASSIAKKIRAIILNGFYIDPYSFDPQNTEQHKAIINEKLASMEKNIPGIEKLTLGEAISATQLAIWKVVHGSYLSFGPEYSYNGMQDGVFARNELNSGIKNIQYVNICREETLDPKWVAQGYNIFYISKLSEVSGLAEKVNNNISIVYNHLISLDPVPADSGSKVVSPASFTAIHDPVFTDNGNGTCDVTISKISVDVDLRGNNDWLKLTATVGDTDHSASVDLVNGNNTEDLIIHGVPISLADEPVYLTISGYQTASGVFMFDAAGNRGTSQTMVGMDNSRLPVFAKVLAQETRVLNIEKTTNDKSPLSGIIFDIYPVKSSDTLPDKATDPGGDAEYTLITNERGKASLNFTQMGLPDGTYVVVEREHPAIVSPIEPFYLYVPWPDKDGTIHYDITLQPKNTVKSVRIEKDVISLGNDSATLNIGETHTWIVGTTIPEDITSGESYVITDTLDSRLSFAEDLNLKVQLESKDGTSVTATLEKGTDYTFTIKDNALTLDVNATGRSTIKNAIGSNNCADYMLRIRFDAKVNSTANPAEEIPNQATLTYKNSVNYTFKARSDIPKITIPGSANVQKVDFDTQDPLAGAVFDLYKAANDQESGSESAVQLPGVNGKVIKVASDLASKADGRIPLDGLAFNTYYLVETQAPPGYNRLTDPIAVVVDATSHEEDRLLTIENKKGSILPETGGMGTEPFLFSGGLLVAASLLLLLSKKRKTS